jgi:putative ABC transport system permease protein
MHNFLQDLRFTLRMLIKSPGFTTVALVALVLGVGANSAIFSVVNAVLLRPLPFKDPGKLISVYGVRKSDNKVPTSPADFVDFREQSSVFEYLAASFVRTTNVISGDVPEALDVASVSADFFNMLGVNAAQGRTFEPEEGTVGKHMVAVLSNGLWQRRYGSDPDAVGQALTINGQKITIIGVMPATFDFPQKAELWIPIPIGALRATRDNHFMGVIGRLKPGMTLDKAQADLSSISGRLEQQYPDTNSGRAVRVVTLQDDVVGNVRLALLILLGAVGFVLLIACSNVANMLLARAVSRQKEIAIRMSLGAGRGRLIRQLLTESLVLSLIGGLLGLLLARWGRSLLFVLAPGKIPRVSQVSIDGWVLGFTVLVSILAGVVFGLAPALQLSRTDINVSLKEGFKIPGSPVRRHSLSNTLVVAEVALAVMLLVGAGLMIKSFLRVQDVDPGFKSKNLLTMQTRLTPPNYTNENQALAFYQQALQQISTLPGVESVGAISHLPLSGIDLSFKFSVEGRPTLPGEQALAEYRSISSNLPAAMGIALIQGRTFSDLDVRQTNPVVLINQKLARTFFNDENPLGKRLIIESEEPPREVVGVVGEVKASALDIDAQPQIYVPFLQRPFASMTFVIRTTGNPLAMVTLVRHQILSVDKDQPVYNINTMEQLVNNSISQRRFSMLLLSVFAAVALILTAVGVYGVLSYSVNQRKHEIGLRMALGAEPRQILKMVVGQGMVLSLVGLCLGLGGSVILTRILSTLLFAVSPTDVGTFLGISLLLTAVALMAAFTTARRAMKLEPMIALRQE